MHRMRNAICVIGTGIVLLGFHAPAFADPRLQTVVNDFVYTSLGPTRLSEHPLAVGATASIGAIMIYGLDSRLENRYARSNGGGLLKLPGAMNDVGLAYDKVGTSLFVLSSAGILTVGGLLTDRPDVVLTAGLSVEAVVFTKIYSALLKRTFSRARPFVDVGPRHFDAFNFGSPRSNRSMPSGHTSSIVAFVTVLAERHRSWWVRVPAYLFAASVAVQRMDSSNHWISDTFFGAALGYGVGRSVSARHQGGSRRTESSQLPAGSLGFTLTF